MEFGESKPPDLKFSSDLWFKFIIAYSSLLLNAAGLPKLFLRSDMEGLEYSHKDSSCLSLKNIMDKLKFSATAQNANKIVGSLLGSSRLSRNSFASSELIVSLG